MPDEPKVLARLNQASRRQLSEDLAAHGTRLAGLSKGGVADLLGSRMPGGAPSMRAERLHAWFGHHGTRDPLAGQDASRPPPPKPTAPDLAEFAFSRWDETPGATRNDFDVVDEPGDGEPVEDLIARREAAFAEAGRRWAASRGPRQLRMPPGPYAVAHFGDPHLDDDGCDWPALLRAVRTVSGTRGFYGGNIGDLVNNWAPGRLTELYGEQSSTIDDGWRLARWMLRSLPWIYVVLGNHDCLAIDTECLTRRGWVSHDQIRPDDLVLSFVPETGLCEWSPILDMVTREHDGSMVSIETQSISALVTPNHRWLVAQVTGRDKATAGWRFTTADQLPSLVRIPVSASLGSPESAAYTDDEIAIAGWVLTDGSINDRGYVSLYQSKQPGVDQIDALLGRLGFRFGRSARVRDIAVVAGKTLRKPSLPAVQWNICADDSARLSLLVPRRGVVPDWVWGLSDRQFGVFLDAIVDGDGHRASDTAWVVYKDRAFLDSLQGHCVARGWRARISSGHGRSNDWRLNICKKGTLEFPRSKASVVQTDRSVVWCLTVPYGNFMVRRNGSAYFTGNCWRSGGTILRLMAEGAKVGLMAPHEVRLELLSPGVATPHRLWARHNFKGSSIWNQAHGPMRASKLDPWADVHVAGHLHEWVTHCEEGPDGRVRWAIRTRGFKRLDDYAVAGQFPEHRHGEVVSTVIDPGHEHPFERVRVHLDVEEAAEHLAWLRRRRMGGAA